MFTSIKDAYYRTKWNVAKEIYQQIWVNNPFFDYVRFKPLQGQMSAVWNRRKKGDAITGTWILPGSAVVAGAHPQVVQVTTGLRRLVHQMQLPSQIVNQVTSMYSDPWDPEIVQAVMDISRQIRETAITGQFIDTVTVQATGTITAAMTGTITSNPYNDGIGRGEGSLKFTLGDSKFAFKAPGDSDFGDGVVGVVGVAMTVRSKFIGGEITFTPAALPATDADCRLAFSSTNLQPDGLNVLMDTDQSSDGGANGDDFSFTILDRLRFRLAEPYQSSKLTAFVLHSNQLIKALELARSMGGASINEVPLAVPAGMQIGSPPMVHTYMGHPLLVCDHIPAVARGITASTRPIFCVNLDPNLRDPNAVATGDGIATGGFGGVVSGFMDGRIEQVNGQGPNGMGFGIEDLGTLQGSDNRAKRLSWNGAWVLGSPLAASRHRFVKD